MFHQQKISNPSFSAVRTTDIGVRGSRTRYLIPGRDGMGAGLGRRVLPSPSPSPPRGGLYEILNRLFSDTYKRSRRDTTAKRLVRPLRFFLVFKKSRNFPKQAYTHFKKYVQTPTQCFSKKRPWSTKLGIPMASEY